MKNLKFKLILVLILIAAISNSLSAQTFLFENIPGEKTQFGLRFMRPSLANDADLSALSGIYDFTVNVPVGRNWSVGGSIPYLNTKVGEGDSENGVGNILIAAQKINYLDARKSSIISMGLYLPTADDKQFGMGYTTHFEKFFKYVPDVLTIYGNFAYFNNFESGVKVGMEIGPDFSIPTKDSGGDTELFFHYGLTAGFQGSHISLVAELIGLAVATEEANEFIDRFTHSLTFGASYVSKNVKPGIFYKLYLKEDLSDLVDGVLGINVEVTLN